MIYSTRYDLLLNLFLCVIDMRILMELMGRMYGPITKYKKAAVCIVALAIIFLMALPSPYDNSFLTLPASFLILWFYPKNPQKKLLFERCLFTIVFSYVFILNDITNMLPKEGEIWIMWFLIAYHIGLWFLLFLCLNLCQTSNENLPLPLWLIFLFIPITTLFSSVLLLFFLNGSKLNRPLSDLMHLLVQSTFLFINIAVFDQFRRFSVYYKKEQEQNLLKQQMKYQEQHYKELLHANSQIKAIRHDMKNHLQTISLLYNNGNHAELLEYINSTTDLIRQTEVLVTSGNPNIDALLGIKLAEMKGNDICCTPKLSIPQNLPLPFSNAVTILGNILDNTITSCVEYGESSEIIFSIIYQQNTLLLHMENPCKPNTLKPYDTGMQNVVNVTKKYSGTIQTQLQNNVYTTDIVLYNLSKNSKSVSCAL